MQFASDLDEDTKKRIDNGRKYVELLKQKQNAPVPFYKQVIAIYGANNGLFDGAVYTNVSKIEEQLLSFIERDRASLMSRIETGRELTDEIVTELNQALADFKEANANLYTA